MYMTINHNNSANLVYDTIVGIAEIGEICFEVLVALVGLRVSDLSCWRPEIASW